MGVKQAWDRANLSALQNITSTEKQFLSAETDFRSPQGQRSQHFTPGSQVGAFSH